MSYPYLLMTKYRKSFYIIHHEAYDTIYSVMTKMVWCPHSLCKAYYVKQEIPYGQNNKLRLSNQENSKKYDPSMEKCYFPSTCYGENMKENQN